VRNWEPQLFVNNIDVAVYGEFEAKFSKAKFSLLIAPHLLLFVPKLKI